MKKKHLIILFLIFSIKTSNGSNTVDIKNDSIWNFHPFSIDLIVGSWIPIRNLNQQFNPSIQAGWSLGLSVYRNLRLSFMVTPRFLRKQRPLAVKVKDSVIYDYKPFGWTIGGLGSYRIFDNKRLCSEFISGVSWEGILTDVIAANGKDSISVSSLGLTLGLNTWINISNIKYFGVMTYYTFSTYNKSKYLAYPIGSSSFNVALIYRIPKRN